MLHSLATRTRTLRHGRPLFARLASRSAYLPPSRSNAIWSRKPLTFLGIGASIAFVVYYETSIAHNDCDDSERTIPRSTNNPRFSFEQDLNRQNILVPDWTDNGIYRVDVASLASNNPIEDTSSLYTSSFSPSLRYTFFGVFDGHNGASTAQKLAEDLPEAVCLHLADVYSKHPSESRPGEPPHPQPASDEIHAAIKAAFVEVDDLIVHEAARRALALTEEEYRFLNEGNEPPASESDAESQTRSIPRTEGMALLEEAYAGSCAILGIYNNLERTLHVAVTGDSRAILGRRRVQEQEAAGDSSTALAGDTRKVTYEIHKLSADQNANNPKEAERLAALHPDEPELLKNGRTLGWGPSRAFGDGVMKWSATLQRRLWKEFLGEWPRDTYKTPPYFTAEPEVTTFEGVKRGDFLILASDGLWDSLTNEEVVGLVGKWLEEKTSENDAKAEAVLPGKVYPRTTIPKSRVRKVEADADDGSRQPYGPSDLPVSFPEDYKDKTVMYKYWRAEKQFVSVPQDDTNVARHIIRNAVGGADRELSETLYKMEGSRRRRFRDDITIQVIFFE